MNIGREVNRYLDALAGLRTPLGDTRVLLPFVVFALIQTVILFCMAAFTTPFLAPVMVPVMHALGGEDALHYPMHFVGLPEAYQRVYLPLVASVGFALWTLAVWRAVDRHVRRGARAARSLTPFLPHILVIGVVFVGTSLLVSRGASSLVGPRTPAMAARFILLSSVVVTAALQTFLVYAPVVLRLRGGNALTALRTSAGYASHNFLVTALMIITVLFVHLPLDFLLARADRVAARFHPETVLQLMLGSVALEMITAYILFAGIVELALSRDGGIE